MTTWTNEEQKTGGTSQTWNSANVTWNSALYEWDGQLAIVWSNQIKN